MEFGRFGQSGRLESLMPVFTFPLALLALLAVPALVAIYWLRSRARERRVSSLLLWREERQRWDGGRRLERLQTPLLFFLELLAILLLALAAAGPMLRAGDAGKPLVVVLDDSFSMLAGNEDSVRQRALQAIETELRDNRYESIRLIFAGEAPQLLGEAATQTEQALKLLAQWHCGAPEAKLEDAIAFAFELGGNRARVLVVTDHPPTQDLSDSRLQWWAFGSARQNFALVSATRSRYDNEDRVLLEVANLSPQAGTTTMTLSVGDANDQKRALREPQMLALGARETRRFTLTLPANTSVLDVQLSDDALRADNQVVLFPETKPTVRVALRVRDAALRGLLEKALQSLPHVRLTPDKPELIIADDTSESVNAPDAWTLQLLVESDAASYLGPFVLDRAHPLSEGVSLGGVVWGAGKSTGLPGTPVITAGNIPLLTDTDRAGRHELRLRFRSDLSTLQQTPNWPVLWWNLLDWRASVAPGLRQVNLHLGGEAVLTTETGVRDVQVRDPRGAERQLPVQGNTLLLRAELAGVYQLRAGSQQYAFAANALRREESDLSRTTSGRWGNWATATALQWEYRGIAWVLLLLALAVLAVHAWLTARNAGRALAKENA